MNTVTLNPREPRTINPRDLKAGQYAIIHYGSENVIVVMTITRFLVGLDGHHSWSSVPDLQCTPLEQGEVITITCGEQI